STYLPQVVVLLMVFNDDLKYNEDMKNSRLSAPRPAGQLFKLWGRVESQDTHNYEFSGSVSEVRKLNEACRRLDAKLAVAFFRNARNGPWLKLVNEVTDGLKGTGVPVLDLGNVLLG